MRWSTLGNITLISLEGSDDMKRDIEYRVNY